MRALRGIDKESPVHQLLEQNIHDLEGLVDTFNSILKISELEANTEFREFGRCDLSAIIGNLVEFYEPYAAEKHITLTNGLTSAIVIHGEKNLLTQAFANLLDNAVNSRRTAAGSRFPRTFAARMPTSSSPITARASRRAIAIRCSRNLPP